MDSHKMVNQDSEGLQHYYNPHGRDLHSIENDSRYGEPKYLHTQTPAKDTREKRNPWGLGPLAFGALVCLVTAVIVGGAVGGGVASMSRRSTSAATVTATVTASPASPSSVNLSDYAVAAPTAVTALQNPCPDIDAKTENIHLNRGTYTFRMACNTNIASYSQVDSSTGLTVINLQALTTYNLDDCLSACVNYNYGAPNLTYTCKGVTWCFDMSYCIKNGDGNCWLKSGTNSGNPDNSSMAATLIT